MTLLEYWKKDLVLQVAVYMVFGLTWGSDVEFQPGEGFG